MAVKKIGAPADSPLRTFVIKHDEGSRNTADKDDIVDHSRVAIKRRMDDHSRVAIKRRMDDRAMVKEIDQLSKEVWDD